MVPSRSTKKCEDTFKPLALSILGRQMGRVERLNTSKDFFKDGMAVQCSTTIFGVISGVFWSNPYLFNKYSLVNKMRCVSKIIGMSTISFCVEHAPRAKANTSKLIFFIR